MCFSRGLVNTTIAIRSDSKVAALGDSTKTTKPPRQRTALHSKGRAYIYNREAVMYHQRIEVTAGSWRPIIKASPSVQATRGRIQVSRVAPGHQLRPRGVRCDHLHVIQKYFFHHNVLRESHSLSTRTSIEQRFFACHSCCWALYHVFLVTIARPTIGYFSPFHLSASSLHHSANGTDVLKPNHSSLFAQWMSRYRVLTNDSSWETAI